MRRWRQRGHTPRLRHVPGRLGKHRTEHSRLWLHATFVALFLVVAHVAMIFGMLNPTLFGYQAMVM